MGSMANRWLFIKSFQPRGDYCSHESHDGNPEAAYVTLAISKSSTCYKYLDEEGRRFVPCCKEHNEDARRTLEEASIRAYQNKSNLEAKSSAGE